MSPESFAPPAAPEGRRLRPGLLALLLCALLASACNSTGPGKEPEPSWVGIEIDAASRRVLFEVTAIALEKLGYPVGSGVDPVAMQAVTGWKTSLGPFKGEGVRKQAELRYQPLDEAGRYRLKVRVKTQTNEVLVRTLDPAYAQWEWAPDDKTAAGILLQHIVSYFEPTIELSPPASSRLGSGR